MSRASGKEKYSLPAVVIDGVVISDTAGVSHRERLSALVDIGADRSVIPLHVCNDLNLQTRRFASPRGFDPQAERRSIPEYYALIRVEGLREVLLRVFGVPRSNILLGRDFLTGLTLVVDSPRLTWRLGCPGIFGKMALRLL
jgi:hypothetical protein